MVYKRDGRSEVFKPEKIQNAVLKAFYEIDGKETERAKNIAGCIADDISTIHTDLSVEQIQDLVEKKLTTYDMDVARKYIIYRNDRTRIRERDSRIMRKVSEKIKGNKIKNQNANVDEKSFGGRVGEASDVVLKQYALDECMSEMARNNHLNNEIYIHDLGSYAVGSHNCLSIPFDKLLANGFNTRQTDVRPAQSVNTAGQLIAVIFQLQSLQQFGGVSATHIDWTLMPYVKKSFRKHYIVAYLKSIAAFTYLNLMDMLFDNYEDEAGIVRNRFDDWIDNNKQRFYDETGLKEDDFFFDNKENLNPVFYQSALYDTIIETKQAVEALYHNLNTLQSRSGNQLPFTSINYGTCTEPEGRMVIKALLDVSISGIGKLHKTSIFPCGIFQLMKGVNRKLGDPNYDLYRLALRSTAQRLYPNYANCNWSGNKGYDPNDPKTYFSTMGCRTANGEDVNGFGQMKDGRGNICPVTIIMPTLAMEAIESLPMNMHRDDPDYENALLDDYFFPLLDKKIDEAKEMLIERYLWICKQSPDSAKFMYENYTMEGYDGKNIESAMKHGTLAIGQLGLAETLQILVGCNHTTEKGMELAKRIEQLFKDRCAEYKKEYSLNFGVYYTPAENLCFTAMTKFREKYGEIPNVSDKKFFTNSMHVPVWEEMSPFEKIDIESQLTGYSSAGCITYVELASNIKNNIDALEEIVNYAMDKDIPYFAVNVPNDMCTNCGYTDEIGDACPMCGCKKIRRLRRVTGYLTGDYTEAFNEGKQQEVDFRVKHF
ncbi:MAG TPA: anaerobic ribonucleoside-triphosphate reductase, partial [Lachnospiraceae bacterium]|nr:anaerobic ribonucleoside-triphosphate reductase [Lachnospiraceae bacterium]